LGQELTHFVREVVADPPDAARTGAPAVVDRVAAIPERGASSRFLEDGDAAVDWQRRGAPLEVQGPVETRDLCVAVTCERGGVDEEALRVEVLDRFADAQD